MRHLSVRLRALAPAVLPLCALTLLACEAPAVSWADDAAIATADPSPMTHPAPVPIDSSMRESAPTAALLQLQDLVRETSAMALLAPHLDAIPEARLRSELPPGAPMAMAMSAPPAALSLGDGDAPIDSLRCARSLREALAPMGGRVAVWWSRRDKGRVMLLAAWRDTLVADARLGAWRGPIVVDSLDQGPGDAQASSRGSAGCSRPAPSVVVDAAHGYVHVGYALTGPEGAGVFYAHQMDPRAGFETPQAIVYGDRLGAVRVAASGDVVALAYDDPNGGERPRVGLAVSRTSGHVFEDRLIASSAIANASDPYIALRGRAIIVGWSEVPNVGGEPTFRFRRALVR